MKSLLFAAVADDDTGATDLAGMLRDQGIRVIVAFNGATPEQLDRWTSDADAVILGTASRSISRQDAFDRTRDAINLLRPLNPRVLFVKYCSTFDSTSTGNIGPSIQAALAACGEQFTIALPALPVLNRTTYLGHHFVGRQLLSESSMRDHPLNPMRNSDLVSHLSTQTTLPVGLAPYSAVCGGAAALKEKFAGLAKEGVSMAIVDCITQGDAETIAEASCDMRLLTGSSALGSVLPNVWIRKGWWTPPAAPLPAPQRDTGGRGFLVVAGSCSMATRAQNENLKAHGGHAIPVDPISLVTNLAASDDIAHRISEAIEKRMTCLVETTSASFDADAIHRWRIQTGLSVEEVGARISHGLATLVQKVLDRVGPEGLIVAGGETSSTLCRALGFGALSVGPQIEPGVPVCVSLGERRLPVVLKSGNFGSADFYSRAIHSIQQLPYFENTERSRE
jgi:3-dehydrotetronate 4-kinase